MKKFFAIDSKHCYDWRKKNMWHKFHSKMNTVETADIMTVLRVRIVSSFLWALIEHYFTYTFTSCIFAVSGHMTLIVI